MAIPTALANFDGTVMALTREGEVPLSTSGPVRFRKGRIAPSLLMVPNGTRDRDGLVTPTLYANVSVVPGEFGPAWYAPPGTGGSAETLVRVSNDDYILPERGTALVRMRYLTEDQGNYPLSSGSTTGLLFGVHSSGYINSYLGSGAQNVGDHTSVPPRDTTFSVGMSWGDGEVSLIYQGQTVKSKIGPDPLPALSSVVDLIRYSSPPRSLFVESVVLFDERIHDDEIERICNLDTAWSWENTHAYTFDDPGIYSAYVAEEGTTNLCRNPYADGATGWGGIDAETEVVEGFGPQGFPRSVKVTTDASSGFEYAAWSTLTIGGATTPRTFNGSIFVFGEPGLELDIVLRMRLTRDGSFRNVDKIETVVCDGTWQRFNVSHTTMDGDVLDQSFSIQIARSYSNFNTRSAATFYAIGGQIEEKAYATSLCPQFDRDGNLLPGYSWSGAENGSASTREETFLTIPSGSKHFSQERGAIAVRIRQYGYTPANRILYFNAPGVGGVLLRHSANLLQFFMYNPGPNSISLSAPAFGEYADIRAEWEPGVMRLQIDDGPLTETPLDPPMVYSPSHNVYIGRFATVAYDIAGLELFDRQLRDSEWAALRAADTWEWPGLYQKAGGILMAGMEGGGVSAEGPILVGGVIMQEEAS